MLSMTGFGAATKVFETARGNIEISVETRTVNAKFLDISIRSPRAYMAFDSRISKLIRELFKRGRIDVNVSVRGVSQEILIHLDQAEEIFKGLSRVQTQLKLSGEIGMRELLAVPDWIQTKDQMIDSEEEWKHLEEVAKESLQKVFEGRKLEGQALEKVIRGHKKKFEEVFAQISARADTIVVQLRERLRERVRELSESTNLDQNRLEQEITLWIARADFREEIDRIRHHLKTFEEILGEQREQGRKLEFLIQELHREVNTMGSKCADASGTAQVIELKTCIERIREQLQNSE